MLTHCISPSALRCCCAGGDACIFAAALFYSLATVRLSRLAASTSSLRLATAKSAAFAVIASAWLAVSAANKVQRIPVSAPEVMPCAPGQPGCSMRMLLSAYTACSGNVSRMNAAIAGGVARAAERAVAGLSESCRLGRAGLVRHRARRIGRFPPDTGATYVCAKVNKPGYLSYFVLLGPELPSLGGRRLHSALHSLCRMFCCSRMLHAPSKIVCHDQGLLLKALCYDQGQKRVPAAQAQIIFSSLPLWSALFAVLLLQGERMGGFGWAGGLLIVCAGLIASRQ